MTDSERVKATIKSRGRTYQDLADEIGVSAQAISEVANGRTTGATARYSLAAALGFSKEDLWEDEIDLTDTPFN